MDDTGYRITSDGLVLSVRITPKAARDGIDGFGQLSDGRMVVLARVRPPPADGAANEALNRLLARSLKVKKSGVTIVSGHTARLKRVKIEGDPTILAETIDRWRTVS